MKGLFKIGFYLLGVMLLLLFSTSGLQAQDEKVWGGVATDIADVPWQVSLERDNQHFCGGTIISPEWVVSARHCTSNGSAEGLVVHAGSSIQTNDGVGQRIVVDEVINFGPFSDLYYNDICLLRLSEPICFNEDVQAIAIADANTVLTPGMIATISGWGAVDANGCCSEQLNSASMPFISDEDANNLIFDANCTSQPNHLNDRMMAFFEPGISVGSGDSGGPAVIEINGAPTLVGVTSWRCQINSDLPSMFTEVGFYSNEILEHAYTSLQSCDARFIVNTNEEINGNLLFTFDFEDRSYYEHSWTVAQHPALGTGPYTQVAQSNDPDFAFQGTLGGCYTFFHEVTTPCETCCFTRVVCNKNAGEKGKESGLEGTDCDVLCDLIPPIDLSCDRDAEGSILLTWSAVPGATGYGVSFVFNDPECCGVHPLGTWEYEMWATDNSLQLNFSPNCMSWTVTPICSKGSGQTSEKACYDSKLKCIGKKEGNGKSHSELRLSEKASAFTAFPNPTTGLINYSITLDETDTIYEIAIMDLSGKIVEYIEVDAPIGKEINGTHTFANGLSGVYFIRVQLDSKVITQKVMLVK